MPEKFRHSLKFLQDSVIIHNDYFFKVFYKMHEKVKGILQNAGNYWKVFKKNEILKKKQLNVLNNIKVLLKIIITDLNKKS